MSRSGLIAAEVLARRRLRESLGRMHRHALAQAQVLVDLAHANQRATQSWADDAGEDIRLMEDALARERARAESEAARAQAGRSRAFRALGGYDDTDGTPCLSPEEVEDEGFDIRLVREDEDWPA